VPVLVWHSLYHTRVFPMRNWADRRTFLRLAGLAVAGFALWQAGERTSRILGLSGADRRFTGSYEAPRRVDGGFPVVSWLNDRPAPVDAAEWTLAIDGAVDRPRVLRFEELADNAEVTATIDCTGGWHSTQVWRGVPVARLLEPAGPTQRASSVTFTSVTSYYRRFSMDEARCLPHFLVVQRSDGIHDNDYSNHYHHREPEPLPVPRPPVGFEPGPHPGNREHQERDVHHPHRVPGEV